MSLNSSKTGPAYRAMLDEYPDTAIAFGPGALGELGGLLLAKRARNVLIFAGGSTRRTANNALAAVMALMRRNGIESTDHQGLVPEPSVKDVRAMRDAIAKEQPDEIVAVGGGSVMDAAKAAFLSFQTGMDVTGLFGVNVASEKFPDRKFRTVLCMPTTAGTGSEATQYANIVDPDSGVKKLLMDHAVIPEYAFVQPEFTHSMPRQVTVSTALDALVHCVESVLNFRAEGAHPHAVEWGIEGIRLVAAGLPKVLNDPGHVPGRTFLAAAAALGGMCIRNRPTSLPHLCSFSFYGQVAHGDAVASLLPPFWSYYLTVPEVRSLTMRLAGIFTAEKETTPEAVVQNAAAFITANGGPANIRALGCSQEIIAKAAADAVLNPVKLQSSPRPISADSAADVITEILTSAW